MQAIGAPQIFVVDDDDDVAAGLSMLLKVNGFVATRFSTAEQFLSSPCGIECWNGGLIDVEMPGMGGLALIDHLRAQSVSLPALLVVTGRVTADVEERAAAAGLPILAKPLDPTSVMTALQRSLAG